MYLEHFGLKEQPFRLTPDSDFLYMSGGHARAKSYMDYTVWNRDGFVVITGEIGCGKTTLLQRLISEFDKNVLVAKIFQTQLDEVEFLQAVLVEFGLNPFKAKKVELIDMLNTFLIESFVQQKQLVLIVDDAHNLSTKVLEEIRMLSSLETDKQKLLHTILVGQSELNQMLESPELEQLLQRVRLRYHIKALGETEVAEYIAHRLRVAGSLEPNMFGHDCISIVHKYTGGVPRLINTLCDTALVCAFAEGVTQVDQALLEAAIEELQWQPYARRVVKHKPAKLRVEQGNRGEVEKLLGDNRRFLQMLVTQIERGESLVSAVSTIATRVDRIEQLLKAIADSLDSQRKETPSTGTARRQAR